MILLQPNTENLIVLSLKEKVTLSAPYYYLFRFQNKESKVDYTCISAVIDEYDLGRQSFEITTKTSGANNLLGEIVLTIGDEYDYFVYAQESATNLDWELANELVGQGIMRFNKTIENRNTYERGTTTRKVYTR